MPILSFQISQKIQALESNQQVNKEIIQKGQKIIQRQNIFKNQQIQKKQFFFVLKIQLIPNYQYLALQVRNNIDFILQTLSGNPQRQILQLFNRNNKKLLEQAPLLRIHIWKLILKTLPLQWKKWNSTKENNRILYQSLIYRFIGKKYIDQDLLQNNEEISKQKSPIIKFDKNLWHQIQLDTKRTHSGLNFYQKQITHTSIFLNRPTKAFDIMSRILYIWGKMNPNVKYVQGQFLFLSLQCRMNQLLAPIYYLEYQNQNIYNNKFNQSQVFFLFSSIMCFVLDMHIREMDQSYEGIMGKIKLLNDLLKVVDYQIWNKLHTQGIKPHFYSFRWLSLMLAQQFNLNDTINLWEVILSFDGYKRYFYLECCCIAILKYYKKQILSQDADIIKILPLIQKVKNNAIDVCQVIKIANKIYEKYKKIDIEKQLKKIDQLLKRKQFVQKNQDIGKLTQLNKKQFQKRQKINEKQQEKKSNSLKKQKLQKSKSKYLKLMKNTSNFILKMIPSALSPRYNKQTNDYSSKNTNKDLYNKQNQFFKTNY